MIELNNLSQKQIEFYNYSLKNWELLFQITIKELALKYGCGISFIYNYFDKIKVSGIKEYFLLVIKEIKYSEEIEKLFEDAKNIDINLFLNMDNQIQDYKLLQKQQDKINLLMDDLSNVSIVYGTAFGHSKLALQDFLGFYSFINSNCEFINLNEKIDLSNYLKKDAILIFYSIRFANEKYKKIFNSIIENKNIKRVFLFTSNQKYISPSDKIVTVLINNSVKSQHVETMLEYVSPINSFLVLNNLLKKNLFNVFKDKLLKNPKFLKETLGWTDYFYAKDL